MPNDQKAQRVLELHGQLERRRAALEDEADELNRLIVPHLDLQAIRSAGGFQDEAPSPYRDDLHDTTACEVHTTLVNGIMAHLTPIGAQWLSLQAGDSVRLDAAAKAWLHSAGQSLLRLLGPSSSNFYTALARSYAMDGAFGTSVIIPRISSARRLVFESLPFLTYSLGADADDNPSTISRQYTLTAGQMVQTFGRDCPAKIAGKAADPATKLEPSRVVHLVEPNTERDPRRSDPANHPFRATWVDLENEETIREEGFYEQPHSVSTWAPSLSGPYGVSPFSEVLPDIRQLQNLALNRAILVERAGNPPWFIPANYDGKFDPRPHGINIPGARGTAEDLMPREIPVAGRLDFLQAEAEDKIRRIKSAGFYDLFRLLTTSIDRQKTAYEVRELMGEKATLFHPFYARKTQQLTGVIRRSLALAIRAGLIQPPPPALLMPLPDGRVAMRDPDVAYNSKLARALELNESNALLSTIEALAPLAGQEGVQSPVFDWLDTAEAGPHLARTYGVASAVMASPEAVEAKRAAREQAARMAQEQAAAESAAKGVRDLGGVGAARQALEAVS